MTTFFYNRYLPDLIDEKDIIVLDFLKAAETIPEFFDMLGTAMKIPKKDIEGNMKVSFKIILSLEGKLGTSKNMNMNTALDILSNLLYFYYHKIGNAYNSLKGRATTLRNLLEEEKKNGSFKNDSSGSVGLLWFTRTLEFIVELMIGILSKRNVAAGDYNDSLSDIARSAYENSLKRHHNYLMGKAFGIVLYACPKCSVLIKKLAYDVDGLQDEVYSSLEDFIIRVKPILAATMQILFDYQLEKPKS